MFFNASTVEATTPKAGLTEVTGKYVRTTLLRFNPTHTTGAGENGADEKYSDHGHTHQWMSVSFFLIGSVITIFIFGLLFYLRTAYRCNACSRYPGLGEYNHGTVIQQPVDDEQPAVRALPEEEQSDDYAEIRFSQFNECRSTFRINNDTACGITEIEACRTGMRKMENVYDRGDNDCEYSRLQLRKKQSRVINYDSRQNQRYISQNQQACVSFKPSDIPKFTLNKANTLPRNYRAGSGYHEQNTKRTHDIIRSTSVSRVSDVQNGSPISVASMDVSEVTREIRGDDAMINMEERPYSFCKL